MVSDYPERLEENGVLFSADLARDAPSRFLYFHYNPPAQPDRRIVLRAENATSEPTIVQFISGRGDRSPTNGSRPRRRPDASWCNVMQNDGALIAIPGQLDDQPCDTRSCRRARSSATCCSCACSRRRQRSSYALRAERAPPIRPNRSPSTDAARTRRTSTRAASTRSPEFHYATQWRVTGSVPRTLDRPDPAAEPLQGRGAGRQTTACCNRSSST